MRLTEYDYFCGFLEICESLLLLIVTFIPYGVTKPQSVRYGDKYTEIISVCRQEFYNPSVLFLSFSHDSCTLFEAYALKSIPVTVDFR